jgi:P4 family phage/plasmid primase-like protien
VEHDPKFGATFTLPFEYNPANAGDCPRWFAFLESCWGDEPDFAERVAALQEMFAATLFGIAPRYQRAFLLFGRGKTGKTQILNVLRAMLPPNAVASLGPQHWDQRFALTSLVGKTANIVGELPENGMIASHVFKEVVEGSPRRTEFKGKDGFDFIPKAAHWFASNFLPNSRDTTDGFLRRWVILAFTKPVDDADVVESLAESIVADERDAIAAWALEGLPRLLAQERFTLPACHEDHERRMRRAINSVFAFLEDGKGLQVGSGSIKCRDLYDLYCFYVRDLGRARPVEFEPFIQMVADLGHPVEQNLIGEYVATGIRKAVTLRAVA